MNIADGEKKETFRDCSHGTAFQWLCQRFQRQATGFRKTGRPCSLLVFDRTTF